jgi:hypothetical protein
MKSRSVLNALIGISLIIGLMIGCSGQKKMSQSGFLSDYYQLHRGSDVSDYTNPVDWGYRDESVNFNAYKKVILEHVVFFFKQDAAYRGIQTAKLSELADIFHKTLIKELSGTVQFTDAPGPGVMRMRIAITQLAPIRPKPKSYIAIIPRGNSVSPVSSMKTASSINADYSALEIEIVDSQTQRRLAAAVQLKPGYKYAGSAAGERDKGFMVYLAKNLKQRLMRLWEVVLIEPAEK